MDDIARRIESAYGSLAEPQFGSVAAALEARPYDALMAEVARVFVVDEDTDPDDDHGFVYGLDRAGLRWVLMISVVGPYAAFARLSDAWDEVLTAATPAIHDEERWLIDVLSRAGVRTLSRTELEEPIDLRLFSVDPGEVRVFHALFTDSPGLPWDREALRRLGLL